MDDRSNLASPRPSRLRWCKCGTKTGASRWKRDPPSPRTGAYFRPGSPPKMNYPLVQAAEGIPARETCGCSASRLRPSTKWRAEPLGAMLLSGQCQIERRQRSSRAVGPDDRPTLQRVPDRAGARGPSERDRRGLPRRGFPRWASTPDHSPRRRQHAIGLSGDFSGPSLHGWRARPCRRESPQPHHLLWVAGAQVY